MENIKKRIENETANENVMVTAVSHIRDMANAIIEGETVRVGGPLWKIVIGGSFQSPGKKGIFRLSSKINKIIKSNLWVNISALLELNRILFYVAMSLSKVFVLGYAYGFLFFLEKMFSLF